jgi:hypothetical protein
MAQPPKDYTEGRTFFQFMFMSKTKIIFFVSYHLIIGFGIYRLLNGGITEADSEWGYWLAWGIVISSLSAYWIGSIRNYKQLKKGISR